MAHNDLTRTQIDFPPKDIPLKDDVRILGALVGDVIREQGGTALYDAVENARHAAIRRREDPAGASERELCGLLNDLSPEQAQNLVHAFTTYFRVVNLAEKIHRIRRRRDYLRNPEKEGGVQPFGLTDSLRRLEAAGFRGARLEELLARLRLEPVFTAHPTEATRRTLLEKQQSIARLLVERLDPSLTPPEERAKLARVRAEVTSAWQTDEHPRERPTVSNEAEHVLFYVTDILYRVVPAFYEDLEAELAGLSSGETLPSVPPMLHFSSWVGGDMDGNPNVDAATLTASLELHRRLILGLYRRELTKLASRLSQSTSRIGVDEEVVRRAESYSELLPAAAARIPPRHREMPYRRLFLLAAERLDATLADDAAAYPDAAALHGDLAAVAASLEAHQGAHAGLFAVRRALRRVETFGFHLAGLDVRQDGAVHRRVLGRLLDDPDWQERPVGERVERLRRALVDGEAWSAPPDAEARLALDVFRAVADARRRHGPRAVGPFIVSMSRDADDLLTVLLLARWGGLAASDGTVPLGTVPLDVVPLFETVPDLERAPEVMERLFADPVYAAHLEARGRRQMVMIGYSDSNKDSGLASSRWSLQTAQAALTRTFSEAAVELTLFHGRGGTVSRGGGKVHRAVMAAPPGAVAGRLRMTEQGEVIDDSYGLRGIALRTLERTWGALALATAAPRESSDTARRSGWKETMSHLAADSRQAYRALVYEDPDFTAFFRAATPIDVIERMRIGSRPASRRADGGVESLRAIPWVFAWTQSRLILPGWYGLGTALEAAIARDGLGHLAEMSREWSFFANLLDDTEMVLAKADLGIAERYAALAGEAGERLFPRVRAELMRTRETLLSLKGTSVLLEEDATLRRSIRLRNPYVDPMSLLQVDLLRRWRQDGRRDEALLRALFATVQGISQGLQNTG